MSECENKDLKEPPHHKRHKLCENRPAYRQGRNLKAVKVYTINDESRHLFIYGVPKINLRNELKSLCGKYGKILGIHLVADHKTEIFTECYHVTYEKIQSSRNAKRHLDDRSFYGSILHVCYAPEHETIEETLNKLKQRKHEVLRRLKPFYIVNKPVDNQIFEETDQFWRNDNENESVPIGPQIPDGAASECAVEETVTSLKSEEDPLNIEEPPSPPVKKLKLDKEKRIVFHNKM